MKCVRRGDLSEETGRDDSRERGRDGEGGDRRDASPVAKSDDDEGRFRRNVRLPHFIIAVLSSSFASPSLKRFAKSRHVSGLFKLGSKVAVLLVESVMHPHLPINAISTYACVYLSTRLL